jgi:hypothetical protein
MNLKLAFPTIALILATSTHAWGQKDVVLPDSCGKGEVKFDVEKHKGSPPPAPPAEGKARIVFIETWHRPSYEHGNLTVRFGLDGAWVGAASFDSYFTIDIAPGEHHLCASAQHSFGMPKSMQKDMIGMAAFTAEPGKIYYFDFKVEAVYAGIPGAPGSFSSSFAKVEDEDGKFLVKSSDLATSKPGK